jgi:hypothetical protein
MRFGLSTDFIYFCRRMKYPLTILFVLLVGLQTFSKMLVILEYEWNKDYIINALR